MKRLLLFALLLGASAFAQQGNTLTLNHAGAPTGTCGPLQYYVNSTTGDFYDCQAGVWHVISGGAGGSGYATIQNAAASLTARTILNWTADIVCSDNVGNARTDCALAAVGTPGTYTKVTTNTKGQVSAGASAKTTDLADFNASAPTASGKIPIWDQASLTYIPGDPFVQGTQAAGSTTLPNPVGVGGSDYGGTPALRALKVDSSGQLYFGNFPASFNVGNFPASQAVTGTFFQATQPVSGTFFQATQPVSIASMPSTPVTGTFFQATQPVSGTFFQATQPVSGTVTVTPPTLTKGTQGATGFSTQDLKDAGRTYLVCRVVRATGVTTEALATMTCNKGGTDQTAATTYTVTSGKTLRLTALSITVSQYSGTAATSNDSARVRTAASCLATSPIVGIIEASNGFQGTAALQVANAEWMPIPDGVEIAATQQICVSHLASATTVAGTIMVYGFEY